MLNEIMDAVTGRLGELFPDCLICTDGVWGTEPCFMISFLEPSEKSVMGQRCFRKAGMCIQYLPGDIPGLSRELNRAADILMDGLEYVTMEDGGLVRGTGRTARFDMEKRILNFYVDYNIFVMKVKAAEVEMDDLIFERSNEK